MIDHTSYDELLKLAVTDGGKMLVPKLSEARKQMSKEEQQAEQSAELTRPRSKIMDDIKKKPAL